LNIKKYSSFEKNIGIRKLFKMKDTMIGYIDTEPTAKSDSISQEIVKD
jgi:hypothetical protein